MLFGLGDYASTEKFINPSGLPETCNTAGGYSFQQPSCWLIGQCLTQAQFAQAEAACKGGGSSIQTTYNTDQNTGTMTLSDSTAQQMATAIQQSKPPVTNTVTTSTNYSNLAPLPTATTATTSVSSMTIADAISQYGLYIAAAVAALLILKS